MDYTRLVQLVNEVKPRVFTTIDGLFDVSGVPPPDIVIGTPQELQLPISVKEGSYMEKQRIIILNPQRMARIVKDRLKTNITLNPRENMERILAKEYASHIHSHLQNFTTLDVINGQPSDSMKTRCLVLTEAIGIVGMFEAYRQFRQLARQELTAASLQALPILERAGILI